jgi:hypothetical protein
MKRLIGFLSVATLAVVLAAPLPAQEFRVTATVPFEFMVSGRTLPAGDYMVQRAGSSAASAIQVSGANVSVLALAHGARATENEKTGQALLVFNRYGDQYFLSRVTDGYRDTGVEIPTSHTEKELLKTASLQKFETVYVLARR